MKSISNLALAFFLILNFTSSAQDNVQKETLYISYPKSDSSKKIGGKDRIRFIIGTESFLYEQSANCKRKVNFDHIKDSLITINGAKEKADEYVDRVIEKWKTESQDTSETEITVFPKNSSIHYFNNYFDDIYLFEKLNKNEGILYEVRWESYVE